MSGIEETRILSYSADHSIPSVSVNGMSRYFNCDEAWQHAIRYIGMRSASGSKLVEITDVYVEGDNEVGVIMAVWQAVKEEAKV